MPDYTIRQRDRGQMFEAEAEAKILASRPLWPRGLNITDYNSICFSLEEMFATRQTKPCVFGWRASDPFIVNRRVCLSVCRLSVRSVFKMLLFR